MVGGRIAPRNRIVGCRDAFFARYKQSVSHAIRDGEVLTAYGT